MAKARDTVYFCKECGAECAKWSGQCPVCKAWNTLVEAPKDTSSSKTNSPFAAAKGDVQARTLSEITAMDEERMETGIGEFDRVLGGGIVKGSLLLVGGDPGIGKSTLLTQVCRELSCTGKDVLYISGEESPAQIKLRTLRLGEFTESFRLLCETDLDLIESIIKREKPAVCIIDSIQTIYKAEANGVPGSISQIRESTAALLALAKGLGVTIIVVGHVTKEGVVAGPRMLEHMVDTVLYFEGDSQGAHRILRSVKNRFGPTNEVGVFEMCTSGLKEVKNPSQSLLSGRPKDAPGSVVSCSMEGTRAILIEIQALAAKTAGSSPRRSASGFDYNRLCLLSAVLEKRLGLRLSDCDVYLNIVGGIRVNDTGLDLAAALALCSSYMDFVISPDTAAVGEVGLSGEVRNVGNIQTRVLEAKRLGFETCIVPKTSFPVLRKVEGINFVYVQSVREAAAQFS